MKAAAVARKLLTVLQRQFGGRVRKIYVPTEMMVYYGRLQIGQQRVGRNDSLLEASIDNLPPPLMLVLLGELFRLLLLCASD